MEMLNALSLLKSTTGTNDKLDLFAKLLSEVPELDEVFYFALSSEIKFGIKKIPDYTPNTSHHQLNMSWAMNRLHMDFATDPKNSNERIEDLKKLLEEVSPEDAKVVEMIIQKKLDCGISVTNANKVFTKLDLPTIPDFKVMLCAKSNEKTLAKMTYPAMAQVKSDGLRIIVSVDKLGNVKYRSRNGKEFEALSVYDELFSQYKGQVFDGEALIKSEPGFADRKTGNGVLNSIRQGKATTEELQSVFFMLWDMIPYNDFFEGKCNTSYYDRYQLLFSSIEQDLNNNGIIGVIDTKVVNTYEQAKEFYLECRGNEEEGIILKDVSKPYEAKRVNHQIKFKAEETADLYVTDIIEGTGKNVGKLGAIQCQTSDGLMVVNVGSGFKDDEREYFWNNKEELLHRIVEVKYNELIDSKGKDTWSLFLPIFEEVRFDKETANTAKELK